MAAANTQSGDNIDHQYDELYEKYGKPLEATHRGEYVAISPDGETFIGKDLLEVARCTTAAFGRGNYLFKIGERVVGKWR